MNTQACNPLDILIILSLCSAHENTLSDEKGLVNQPLDLRPSHLKAVSNHKGWNHRARGIEVTSIATSKTNRICRSDGYCLPCRCAASNALWRSQKAIQLRKWGLDEMLSVPGTVNMKGNQTINGMRNLLLQWGMFGSSVERRRGEVVEVKLCAVFYLA